MLCNESKRKIISCCCCSVLPTDAAVGQSIFATVAIHAPRNVIRLFADRLSVCPYILTYTTNKNRMLQIRFIYFRKTLCIVRCALYNPLYHVEYPCLRVRKENVGEMLPVGISDEYLSETVAVDHAYNTLHTLAI